MISSIPFFLSNLENENKFSFYLSAFRIFICFHLIKKIFLYWESLSIFFDVNSFSVQTITRFELLGINPNFIQSNYDWFIFSFVILLIIYAFGIGKYFTAILLFFYLRIFQNFAGLVLNGGDNLLIFIVIYTAFSDNYQFFSINKLEAKGVKQKYINFFSNLAGYSIMLHLSLVYFISAINKVHSDVWFSGIATYYTLGLERYKSPINHLFINNGYFVTFTTYFTLLFELYFPILIWIKAIRPFIIVSGILLHLGIYIFMMIYDFQTVFIAVYGFFITNSEWLQIKKFLENQINKLTFKILKV